MDLFAYNFFSNWPNFINFPLSYSTNFLSGHFIVLKRDKYFCRDTTIIKELPVIDRTFFNYSYYEKILRNSSDELGMLYFEDCLCMGNSLNTFARANNLTYYEASKVKDKVINELKKNIE